MIVDAVSNDSLKLIDCETGRYKTISYYLSNNKSGSNKSYRNVDYIISGDTFYDNKLIATAPLSDSIFNFLCCYINTDKAEDISRELGENIYYLCKLTDIIFHFCIFKDRKSRETIEKVFDISDYRKISSFSYHWILRVTFREEKLLGEYHTRFAFGKYPLISPKVYITDEKNIYYKYWLKIENVNYLLSLFNKTPSQNRFNMYKLSRQIFSEYCNGKIYLTKSDIYVSYRKNLHLVDRYDSSKFGFYVRYKNGKKIYLTESIIHSMNKLNSILCDNNSDSKYKIEKIELYEYYREELSENMNLEFSNESSNNKSDSFNDEFDSNELNNNELNNSKSSSNKSDSFNDEFNINKFDPKDPLLSDSLKYIQIYEDRIGYSFDTNQRNTILSTIISNSKVINITGMPGTGKSSITVCILFILHNLNLTYIPLTFTGKASVRLNSLISKYVPEVCKSITCHSFFCSAEKEKYSNKNIDMIIFDESSMLSINLFLATVQDLNIYKYTFVGDINQIPCVNDVGIFGYLINKYNSYELTTIHRNKFKYMNEVFLREKTLSSIRSYDKLVKFKRIRRSSDSFKSISTFCKVYLNILSSNFSDRTREIYERYRLTTNINKYDFSNNICLTYTNDTREQINHCVRLLLELTEYDYQVGEYMIILTNDYGRKIMNGDQFIIVEDLGKSRICYFPDLDKEIELSESYLESKSDYAYCLTKHKSQGSEWSNVLIYLDEMTREQDNKVQHLSLNLLYTAINRASDFCYIYVKDEKYLDNKLEYDDVLYIDED